MDTSGASSQATTNSRTSGEVVIHVVTTHIFAISNYVYMSTLQQRSTRTYLHLLRILLFAFVPTLIIVEIVHSTFRSLIRFIQDQVDETEEEKKNHLWFYLSAAISMHASMPTPNQSAKGTETQKIPLLKLHPALTDRKRVEWSWAWFGKLFATLFALTQAIGSTLMYARRLDRSACLEFDHRNGAMGIASTVCSVLSLLVLLLRFDWSVSRGLQTSTVENNLASRSTLLFHTFMAIYLRVLISGIIGDSDKWLYSSVGVFFTLANLFGFHHGNPFTWEFFRTALGILFISVFRKEIATKIGVNPARYQRWIKHRSWLRIKTLLGVVLVIWCVVDIARAFAKDIENVIFRRDEDSYWWQDPISDKIFVI